jgi:glycine betaine/proline transport system substrate-binding protein
MPDARGRKHTTMRISRKSAGLLATAAVTALALTACATDENGEPGTPGDGDGALAGQTITIGVFEGWEEGIAASYLWGHILAEEGAEVNYQFADPAFVYEGVAGGDYDVSFDAWLPATHEDYWAEHGADMEDLGTWFDDAPLTIAVNEDAPIQSLADLADASDQFGNRIVGIEEGAGLTRITRDQVIPTYGLDGMEFLPSSTPAMLTELQAATDAGENIVVTLWRPHWAYDAFPIRDLEDPENALGDPEEIHAFARTGFSDDYPEVTEWISNFWLTDDELHSLENIMFFENEGEQNEESVQQWLDENPDYIDRLKAGELG